MMEGSDLDERLCFNLYNIQRQVNRFYSDHVLHDTDLTYTQYLVLTLLWQHEKLNLKSIAELLQLDNATISPMIKRIEASGYVKREKDVYDQRHVYITATEAGKELKEKIGRRHSMFTDHLSLDEDKIEELLDALKLIDSDLNKTKITQQ
jgi:DNA-binding MarR family transcriptional regulator